MDKQKLKPLMALFTAFPSQDRAGTEDDLARLYMMAVQDISAEYVGKAVTNFISGKVDRDRHTFRPSPAEVAIEARRVCSVEGKRYREMKERSEAKQLDAPMTKSEAERAEHVKRVLGAARAKMIKKVNADMIGKQSTQTQ